MQDGGPLAAPALVPDELDMALLSSDELFLEGMDHFLHTKDGPGNYQSMPLGPEVLESGTEILTPVAASAPSFLAAGSLSNAHADAGSLVPIPDQFISPLNPPPSQRISSGCRRFILSILRTYPRMMTGPGNLPPFIHPVGCGLHFNHRDGKVRDAYTTGSTASALLKPLAACQSIAQIFVSRTPNTSDFIWRTIENERRTIHKEVYYLTHVPCCPTRSPY